MATRSGAAKAADFTKLIVDTTVQPKAITFPTDAKLLHRAREKLVGLAQKLGVTLRQSYVRVGKVALIRHQHPQDRRSSCPAGVPTRRQLLAYQRRFVSPHPVGWPFRVRHIGSWTGAFEIMLP